MARHAENTLAAVKAAVDIATLAGEYVRVERSGRALKALCPFHDDHNPSMELNPDRQSFKCWVCGAGGDVFDFLQRVERIEFPEALRMLAERAGITLDAPEAREREAGASKSDLLACCAWAESAYFAALPADKHASEYLERRGITAASVERFRLGYAPTARDWLMGQARRAGFSVETLDRAGLVARNPETNIWRERFRGRLIFPIHDFQGRAIGFGGRILPEAAKKAAEAGMHVAKYLNSPETPLFQKRRQLYAADLARQPARDAQAVIVVEGYTDVVALHQAGIANAVAALGTALGDDHVVNLRRLADRVVLVLDGDDAGQAAADKVLSMFLAHDLDFRLLTLPDGEDPAEAVAGRGAEGFRTLMDGAEDPLDFALRRAEARHDFQTVEGTRRGAEAVLAALAKVPRSSAVSQDLKLGKALDALSRRSGLAVADLKRNLNRLRAQPEGKAPTPPADASAAQAPPIRPETLDRLDRELVELVLGEPALIGEVITRVMPSMLRDLPLRQILQSCYDLHGEGLPAGFDRVSLRLRDPAVRSLAAGLSAPVAEAQPLSAEAVPASTRVRLDGLLTRLDARGRHARQSELLHAYHEAMADPEATAGDRKALQDELLRHLSRPPDPPQSAAC